ncbi:MAG TPA: glycosyltransferase [Cellvibrio sp.]|nr:glycosyltransferase [Cellvibrio sp.]
MKVLFLTSSPGYGHTRAAEAIVMALRNHSPDIETDCLNVTHLIDEQVSAAVQDGYLRMTAEQPELYQKLYDMDRDFYSQLAGKVPADKNLVDFLSEQQRRWYPEVAERSLFSFSGLYGNLDSALLNSLINGICNRTKISAGRLVLQGLLGLICSILATRLKNYVNACQPDLLVATQMYPNALLSRAIKKGAIKQPIIAVPTDYGAHGVWVRDTTDLYCVSHQTVADSLQAQGVKAARIRITGIPLMPEFENPPTQTQARINLGLSERPTILITGGQCGIGIVAAVKRLVQDTRHAYQVLVTAGDNLSDCEELKNLAKIHRDRFTLYQWRSSMVELLSAADVVVGKPGGLTVSESLACGRPFIATCCLGGQEAHNVAFLQAQGAGSLVDAANLPEVLEQLFSRPEQLRAMKLCAAKLGRRYAARSIVTRISAMGRGHKDADLNQRLKVTL